MQALLHTRHSAFFFPPSLVYTFKLNSAFVPGNRSLFAVMINDLLERFDKFLNEKNVVTDWLGKMEGKTGVKKKYLSFGKFRDLWSDWFLYAASLYTSTGNLLWRDVMKSCPDTRARFADTLLSLLLTRRLFSVIGDARCGL